MTAHTTGLRLRAVAVCAHSLAAGAVALATAAAAGEAATQRIFRVHPLGMADGSAAAAVAAQMVADGGRVTLDARHNRLLVFATEAEHERVASLAQAVAAPSPMVAIEVRRRESASRTDRRAAVGLGGSMAAGGGGGAAADLAASFSTRSAAAAERSVQTLTVSSGRSASIQVGEQIPYPAWWQARAIEWGLWNGGMAWQSVGSFLVVEPTVVGEGAGRRVHVRLTPEVSVAAQDGPVRVRFARMSTEVMAVPGETIRLGSLSADREFHERFLGGGASGGEHGGVDFEMTVRVLDPPAR